MPAATCAREELLAAWKHSARMAIAASALATLPYAVFNLAWAFTAEGSIAHMAPGEWVIWTVLTSLVLWLGSAMILTVSAIATRHNIWLSAPLALLVFAGIGLGLLGGSWRALFDPFEHGLNSWVFVVGVLSTIGVLILKWMAMPEVALG